MAIYDIASLWVGPSLTWMEQICLKSFVDHGHKTVLYSYDPVEGVPDGVEQRDANEVFPSETILRHERTGSPAHHSDIFRLKLLEKTDYLWVDTDAYCLKPWERPDHGFFYGWGNDRVAKVYTGVIGLPKDSKTLTEMLRFAEDEYPIPPWLRPAVRRELIELKAAGTPVPSSQLRWGVLGPDALNFFASRNGEIDYAMPGHVLYPISFERTRVFGRVGGGDAVRARIKPDTLSIHFYGRRFRNLFAKVGGMPPEGCFMYELCEKHGIDPSQTAHLITRDKRDEHDAQKAKQVDAQAEAAAS